MVTGKLGVPGAHAPGTKLERRLAGSFSHGRSGPDSFFRDRRSANWRHNLPVRETELPDGNEIDWVGTRQVECLCACCAEL